VNENHLLARWEDEVGLAWQVSTMESIPEA
jgi:hypothetical protein